jgi:hypothetical protein
MSDALNLLTDLQIQQFIVNGYLIVQADDVPDLHARIRQTIEDVYETEGNLGNNILPRIPDIARVFEHPNVAGALISLLGPDYILNPHRHGHLNPPGGSGQKWHKDCYVYDHNIRHPRFDWILAFYYPQDTTDDMGPSGILPQTQFQRFISDSDATKTTEEPLSICGAAGTVALIHFDSWHRATANTSEQNRYMLKFQFARTREPDTPTWDHRSPAWSPGIEDPHPAISQNVWDWLCGRMDRRPSIEGETLVDLADRLSSDSEPVRLDAAYRLVGFGEEAIQPLVDAMRAESIANIDETTAKPADNLHGTNPTTGCATQGLTAIGPSAIPALEKVISEDDHWWVRAVATNALSRMGRQAAPAAATLIQAADDDHWWVRRNAIEALGRLDEPRETIIAAVATALADKDYRVRRAAALAVIKIGPAAAPAVNALVPLLDDENRYNRFYSELALRRIGTPEANDILLDALFTARWCPVTTKDDRF